MQALISIDSKSVILGLDQTYNNLTLVKITKQSVVLKSNGKTYILELGRENYL